MALPDYAALLERLFNSRRKGMRLGLDRIRRVLDALGHPHHDIEFRVAIGGTNGKGSTAAFVESIARAAGYRVGVFSSPHLCQFAERFRVDGEPAAQAAVVAAESEAAEHGSRELTFFEQTAVIAAVLLARQKVDIGIFEVGLGGRLDATRAMDAHVAAVTGVALDHCEYLGDTIEAIAAEKIGLLTAGQMVAVGGEHGELLETLAAERRVAAVERVGDRRIAAVGGPVGLAGPHQVANAAMALAVIDALESVGLGAIDASTRARGLAEARLRGRFETVAGEPPIVFDCAHNPAAAAALASSVRRSGPAVVAVVGMSADKDTARFARALAGVTDAVIATRADDDRACDPAAIAAAFAECGVDAEIVARDEALEKARARAGQGGRVLVTGSFYVVGDLYAQATGVPSDPVVLSDPVGA